MKILIIGNGFVGSRCLKSWPDAVMAAGWISSVTDVLRLLDKHRPDVVLNAAGVIGKPNVDWCEAHQEETHDGNVILPYIIAKACQQRSVYLLHIGSGCIYYGDSPHSGGWREDDYANPAATYTKSKYAADLMLMTLHNVGIARIRMPLDSTPFAGNIIDKLASYSQIIDVENSLTVIDDMVLAFRQLLEKKASGIYHVVNEGSIKHREIIELYEELVDPNHSNEWIDESELVSRGLTAKIRSSNVLSSENLKKIGIKMRSVKEAVRDAMIKYAKQKNHSN